MYPRRAPLALVHDSDAHGGLYHACWTPTLGWDMCNRSLPSGPRAVALLGAPSYLAVHGGVAAPACAPGRVERRSSPGQPKAETQEESPGESLLCRHPASRASPWLAVARPSGRCRYRRRCARWVPVRRCTGRARPAGKGDNIRLGGRADHRQSTGRRFASRVPQEVAVGRSNRRPVHAAAAGPPPAGRCERCGPAPRT